MPPVIFALSSNIAIACRIFVVPSVVLLRDSGNVRKWETVELIMLAAHESAQADIHATIIVT